MKKFRVVAAVLPVIGVSALMLLSDRMIHLTEIIPPCVFHQKTGLYCPACGNTRSVCAMLRGDIASAVRYNATIPFIAMLLVLLYFENLLRLFKMKTTLIPRSNVFLVVSISAFLMYYVIRNVVPFLAPS